MKPASALFVCMTPRSGSSFFCEVLKATQSLGNPEEYYTAPDVATLMDRHEAASADVLQTKILNLGTTANGIFSVKLSTGKGGFEQLGEILRLTSTGTDQDKSIYEYYRDAFPDLRCIFLTRRNKIRQAVSWWKAIQTNQWGLRAGEQAASNEDLTYNFDALTTLLQEIVFREAGWQAFFEAMHIKPVTVWYEDLVSDYSSTIQNLLLALEEPDVDIPVPPTTYRKQEDDLSETWVQRFRKEKQEGWQNVGW